MKKLLIISYYYPDCQGISAWRPYSFAENLSADFEVKVITRQWEGNEKTWEDHLKSNHSETTTFKKNKNLEVTHLKYNSKIQDKSKLNTICKILSGKLDFEIDTTQFYPFAFKVVSDWDPHYILVSCPPKNLVNLGHKLSKINNSKLILDFRDFDNEILLNGNNTASLKARLLHKIELFFLKKKMKNASLITTINEPFVEFFKQFNLNSHLIYNGFEESIFGNFIPINDIQSKTFNVSMIGTIYEGQEYKMFLEAFDLYIKGNPTAKIKFLFIGSNESEIVTNTIKNSINPDFLFQTPRIKREKAISYMENSHLLWFPDWIGFKGMFSGKIFEYLGAKRNILIGPSVKDVLEELINETDTGYIADSVSEIYNHIDTMYKEWEDNNIQYNGDNDKINFYSREKQAQELSKLIHKC